MTSKFTLAEETFGYQTSTDPSNTDKRLLIAGSQNVIIDYQKKVKIRAGYTRIGVANSALTPILNAWTWHTSTGFDAPQRNYNGVLEVWLNTVDTVAIGAWSQISAAFSTTKKLRPATWFSSSEDLDMQIMTNGDSNLYMWGGGVAVVDSVTVDTITKKGTSTWGQNRFFALANMTMVCVRTGTEYTYAGGVGTLTLTGVGSTVGLVAGDILVQKIVTLSNQPAANRQNDAIFSFENQIVVGSEIDELVYISKNTSVSDYTYSTPRVSGEGGLLTLDDPTRAINSIGEYMLVFAGRNSIFRADYQQITVSTTLAETLRVKKFNVGVDQGALNHESVVPVANSLFYLTNEVTLRSIDNPDDFNGIDPKTYSNPIKPDFDVEDWDGAFGFWSKNTLLFSAPANSHLWMLNFIEDADGKLFRYWNPPQILPVGAMSIIDTGNGPALHAHSNTVAESYLLFDGLSDGQYASMDVADKLPIHAIANYAYNNYKERAALKTHDEYFVEGEITPSTNDLLLELLYEFDGSYQKIDRTIDGTDEGILTGSVVNNSLAQAALAIQPLGGLLSPPASARRFRVVFEYAREDFHEQAAKFETNETDRYWAIIAHGANATLSPRRDTTIRR